MYLYVNPAFDAKLKMLFKLIELSSTSTVFSGTWKLYPNMIIIIYYFCPLEKKLPYTICELWWENAPGWAYIQKIILSYIVYISAVQISLLCIPVFAHSCFRHTTANIIVCTKIWRKLWKYFSANYISRKER